MAKLNQPADFSHALPAVHRTPNTSTSSPTTMSPPPLCPISLQVSLQSNGNDNLPPSPPHRGSPPSLLSPTDCRALKKIMRDVGHSSPPATPSPLKRGEQLFADTGRTGSNADGSADRDGGGYHLVSNEAADTGYEDENDSMGLSEGVEGDTIETYKSASGRSVSPTVFSSNLQPQDTVSTHADRARLSYTSHGPSSTKYKEIKQGEPNHHKPAETLEGDTIEDLMNLPGKSALPARSQKLDLNDSDHRPVPTGMRQLDWMRLSTEKMVEYERLEQERATHEPEPGVFIPSPDAPRYSMTGAAEQQSVHETFNSDNENKATTSNIAKTQHMGGSQHLANSVLPAASTGPASQTTENAIESVLNSSSATTPAPDWNQPQFATNKNIPETPFTKTLSYFKQYKGAENSPSRRRRNTALPQEIAYVVEEGSSSKDPPGLEECEKAQRATRPPICPNEITVPQIPLYKPVEKPLPEETDEPNAIYQMVMDGARDGSNLISKTADKTHVNKKVADAPEQAPNDVQKQLILYPQHPAFVNAISMIPATIFWATAAPIVKYTNIAVDLLIDKLRDTYL